MDKVDKVDKELYHILSSQSLNFYLVKDRPRQTISVSISCSRTFLELRSSFSSFLSTSYWKFLYGKGGDFSSIFPLIFSRFFRLYVSIDFFTDLP